jgi:hypothetical protein
MTDTKLVNEWVLYLIHIPTKSPFTVQLKEKLNFNEASQACDRFREASSHTLLCNDQNGDETFISIHQDQVRDWQFLAKKVTL